MKFLNETDPYAKTIIFCDDIEHAERMRKAIVNEAGQIAIDNPKYVMRITGDSPEGKAELDNFIDPSHGSRSLPRPRTDEHWRRRQNLQAHCPDGPSTR